MGVRHGNIPPRSFPWKRGEWQIRAVQRTPEERERLGAGPALHIVFGCPLHEGEACGVPLLPDRLPNGAGWQWDGDPKAPTLTPSINCLAEKDGKKTGGCGWHGTLERGVFKP